MRRRKHGRPEMKNKISKVAHLGQSTLLMSENKKLITFLFCWQLSCFMPKIMDAKHIYKVTQKMIDAISRV